MLHVILLILKILGIILLSILCLVLLILLAVLFAAVSYRVRVQKSDAVHVSASIGWLFRIITVNYQLDVIDGTKQDLRICLFGIPILKPMEKMTGKPKPKKEKRKKSRKKEPAIQAETVERPVAAAEPTVTEEKNIEETVTTQAAGKQESYLEEQSPLKKKESIWKKIRRVFHKINHVIDELLDKKKNLQDMIQGLLEKKDKYLGFWNQEDHRSARGAIWKELVYILKKIRPKKLEGKVHFGFEDPSLTGKIYGAACVLYAWYPKKFELVPDFEHEVIECDISVKGKIRLYIFVCVVVRMLFNRDVRNMYKHWKQL